MVLIVEKQLSWAFTTQVIKKIRNLQACVRTEPVMARQQLYLKYIEQKMIHITFVFFTISQCTFSHIILLLTLPASILVRIAVS